MPNYYAVQAGRQAGVYRSWKECQEQINKYPGSKFKKFATASEAEAFLKGTPSTSSAEPISPDASGKSATLMRGKKRARSPVVDERETSTLHPESGGVDVVYCDGACPRNGSNSPIAGIGVWWGADDDRNLSERCPGDQTNNRAELVAIARVLETAPTKKTPLEIRTDSQYSCNCFDSWLAKWERNGYKVAGGQPVKNLELILYINTLLGYRKLSGQKVTLKHIRGHSGIAGNEEADALASHGALLPPENERNWQLLEAQVRKKMSTLQNGELQQPLDGRLDGPRKALKGTKESSAGTSISPPLTPATKARRNKNPVTPPSAKSITRNNVKSDQEPITFATPIAKPQDIDYNWYAEGLLDEADVWKDLQDQELTF